MKESIYEKTNYNDESKEEINSLKLLQDILNYKDDYNKNVVSLDTLINVLKDTEDNINKITENFNSKKTRTYNIAWIRSKSKKGTIQIELKFYDSYPITLKVTDYGYQIIDMDMGKNKEMSYILFENYHHNIIDLLDSLKPYLEYIDKTPTYLNATNSPLNIFNNGEELKLSNNIFNKKGEFDFIYFDSFLYQIPITKKDENGFYKNIKFICSNEDSLKKFANDKIFKKIFVSIDDLPQGYVQDMCKENRLKEIADIKANNIRKQQEIEEMLKEEERLKQIKEKELLNNINAFNNDLDRQNEELVKAKYLKNPFNL
jgi:hypothetical protein